MTALLASSILNAILEKSLSVEKQNSVKNAKKVICHKTSHSLVKRERSMHETARSVPLGKH